MVAKPLAFHLSPRYLPTNGLVAAYHPEALLSGSAAFICRDLEIEIVPTTVRPGPNQTCADATLTAILNEHGPGHLTLVLRTIVESAGNERALKAPIIWAVSDLILTQRAWADRGLEWLEAFDDIDLLGLMRAAQPNRKAVQLRAGICTLLFGRLSKTFAVPSMPSHHNRVVSASICR